MYVQILEWSYLLAVSEIGFWGVRKATLGAIFISDEGRLLDKA